MHVPQKSLKRSDLHPQEPLPLSKPQTTTYQIMSRIQTDNPSFGKIGLRPSQDFLLVLKCTREVIGRGSVAHLVRNSQFCPTWSISYNFFWCCVSHWFFNNRMSYISWIHRKNYKILFWSLIMTMNPKSAFKCNI